MGDRDMKEQPARLLAAENDLKQLMADVSRAMETAQDAIAKTKTGAASPEADAAASPH